MAVFKDYSFEYNSRTSDIFKTTLVLDVVSDSQNYREGDTIEIEDANFYGIIIESTSTENPNIINIVAESYARELKNDIVEYPSMFKQINAIELIENYLIPDGWTFEYPGVFNTDKRHISYILRNGTYISHISNILQILGLDFAIYTTKSGGTLHKTIRAFFRDGFTDVSITNLKEYCDFGNLSITCDYNKIATSIVVMGAESEVGINQVWMDAEMKNWADVPRILELKDTIMRRPEMSSESPYFYYFPASPDNFHVDMLSPGDEVYIDNEKLQINSIWKLPETRVASWEYDDLDDSEVVQYFSAINEHTHFDPGDACVASADMNATVTLNSVNKIVTLENRRDISGYGGEAEAHAIYDNILVSSGTITTSSYFTQTNTVLPYDDGFVWFGSERVYYEHRYGGSGRYILTGMVRGVPTCASPNCMHCGTRDELNPIGWSYGCPYGGFDADECISKYCTLAQDIKTAFGIDSNITVCPLVFDINSPCPVMKCPHLRSDEGFRELCPQGLDKSEIVWTDKYPHHKDTVVFPDYYNNEYDGSYVNEPYHKDSFIKKYGYIPTQISVKGVGDTDGLDKAAEGYLRLSGLPISGSFTHFSFDPWAVPDGLYPGNAISVEVASYGVYDLSTGSWYPTHWFDYASQDDCPGELDEWMNIPSDTNHWYKIKHTFIIQKTIKRQRSSPEVHFGTPGAGFKDTLEYIKDSADTSSQRHRNQEIGRVEFTTDSGVAAKVTNIKTGEQNWVRMIK